MQFWSTNCFFSFSLVGRWASISSLSWWLTWGAKVQFSYPYVPHIGYMFKQLASSAGPLALVDFPVVPESLDHLYVFPGAAETPGYLGNGGRRLAEDFLIGQPYARLSCGGHLLPIQQQSVLHFSSSLSPACDMCIRSFGRRFAQKRG